MISKNIQHLAIVSLKHFFDIDYTQVRHSFIIFILAAALVKLFAGRLKSELQQSFVTVKEDYATVKEEVAALAQKIKEEMDRIASVVTDFVKNELLQKETWTWKTK